MLSRKRVLLLVLFAFVTSAFAQKTPIQITADLSEAPRKLVHAELDMPVTAGPLVLTTPKWLPGHHGPGGPVADITGVVFTANGKTLPWRRDDVDLYQFHLTVPRVEQKLLPFEHGLVVGDIGRKRSTVGLLLAGNGQEVTYPLVVRLKNLHRRGAIKNEVAVLVARNAIPEDRSPQ